MTHDPETHLVSFLPYLDVDVESVPSADRIRSIVPRNGRGSQEETYPTRDAAMARVTALTHARLVEVVHVYEADKRYTLGRKLVWEWKEGDA
jgi:hypothetical protein